jgi:predicted MFS family arabinose efflux permease
MAEELRWDLTRAGVMTTANGLGYLAGAVVTPLLARRLGLAGTFRLGMVLCATALAATAVTISYPALLAARASAGVGAGLVFITGAVLAPTAVYFAGTGLGIAISGAAIPPLLDQHPDRWSIGWIGLAAMASLAAVASWTAARPGDPPAAGQRRSRGRPSIRPLWPVAVAYLLFAAGYIAYITFLSAYLADRGASAAQAALTWTLLGLAVMAAPTLWQRPIARWPGSRALAVVLGLLSAAATLPLLNSTPPVVIVSAVAYGATFMAVPAAVTELVRKATTPAKLTGTLAAFTVVFAAGQTAGPWLAGALADHTTAAAPLTWTAALCGAAAILAAIARPPKYTTSTVGTSDDLADLHSQRP